MFNSKQCTLSLALAASTVLASVGNSLAAWTTSSEVLDPIENELNCFASSSFVKPFSGAGSSHKDTEASLSVGRDPTDNVWVYLVFDGYTNITSRSWDLPYGQFRNL